MSKEVSYKIAWTTFCCNIIILLHHANLKDYFPERANIGMLHIMDFFSILSIPAMTWFFFISGFLFYRKFKLSDMTCKWHRRVNSLLIPYIIWNTCSLLLLAVKGGAI